MIATPVRLGLAIDESQIRFHCHRWWAGRTFLGGALCRRRQISRDHRTPSLWRHMCQQRLHSNQNAHCECTHCLRYAPRSRYGGEVPTAGVKVNMRAVQARKKRVVDASRTGLENWIRGMQNCTVYKGHAILKSARSVSVDGEVLTSEQIFINVGGRPRIPVYPGIE